MILERTWAMPNKRTFEIKPIKQLMYEEMAYPLFRIEPFPFEYD